jgi:hypothetical protein
LQEQKRSQNRQAERMMQRRMMKLQAGTSMNGSAVMGGPSTSQQPAPGPSSIPPNWTQPPQSPAPIHQSQFAAPQQMQQQMSQQAGMMISPNTYQMRINGPVGMHRNYFYLFFAKYFILIENSMANQMINSPTMMSGQQGAGGYGQMVSQPPQMQQVQMVGEQ